MIDLSNRAHCFYWQTDRELSPEDYAEIFLKRHEIADDEIAQVLREGVAAIDTSRQLEIVPADENVVKGNVNIVRKVLIDGRSYVVRIHPKGVKNGYFYVEQAALRIKRFQVDKSDGLLKRLEAGKLAMAEELHWFKL